MSTRRPRWRAGLLTGALLLGYGLLPISAARGDVTPTTGPTTPAAAGATGAVPVASTTGPRPASASAASPASAGTTATATTATTATTAPSAPPSSALTATAAPSVTPAPSRTSATTAPTGPASVTDPDRQFLATATPIATSTDGLPILGTLVFGPSDPTKRQSDVPQTITIKDGLTCPDNTVAYTTFLIGPTPAWQAVTIVVGDRTTFTKDDKIEKNFTNSLNGVAAENSLDLVKGRYDVTLICFSSIVARAAEFTGSFWVVEDLGTKPFVGWSPTDPENTTLSTSFTSLVTEPANKLVEGGKVVLRAFLSPSTAAGTVQFSTTTPDGTVTKVGSPVTVTSGSAGLEVSGLTSGLYSVSAAFTPTSTAKFTAATSDDVPFAVVKSVPPVPPTSVAISGTPKVGTAVTCAITGAFQNATSAGWQWLRDFEPIDGATTASYTPQTEDRKHLLRCRATGTNAGGTSGRLSPGALVAS